MSKVRVNSVRISKDDFERLQELSEERAVPVRTLIRSFIHQQLANESDDELTVARGGQEREC